MHFAEIKDDPLYNFEKLFNNLKIINNKTTKDDLENYFEEVRDKRFEINLENFNNNFSASKLINELF